MSTQLTTLGNVKAWLGLTSDTSDATLTRLITAASAWIENYLGRTIAQANYSQAFDGQGGYRLVLPEYPVNAVASVAVDGIVIMPATGTVSVGFVFNRYAVSLRGYRFTRGVQNVSISWTAGYSSVPADVEQAAIHLVSARFREKDRIGQASKVVAGENVTFSIRDMPADVVLILNFYRRVAPV